MSINPSIGSDQVPQVGEAPNEWLGWYLDELFDVTSGIGDPSLWYPLVMSRENIEKDYSNRVSFLQRIDLFSYENTTHWVICCRIPRWNYQNAHMSVGEHLRFETRIGASRDIIPSSLHTDAKPLQERQSCLFGRRNRLLRPIKICANIVPAQLLSSYHVISHTTFRPGRSPLIFH